MIPTGNRPNTPAEPAFISSGVARSEARRSRTSAASRSGANATSAELEQFCRQRLATYKIPRSFDLVASLPKNPTGKILKRVLRDEAAQP